MATVDTAGLTEQYAILTGRCGVVDRSERGKLALAGAGAIEFLNGQVTNELVDLKTGEGRYAAFLTHKGKMLGDLRILAAGPDRGSEPSELLLDTERVALQGLFDMIRRFKVGYDVELHKRTLECALLSLIGPTAAQVAAGAFSLDPPPGSVEPSEAGVGVFAAGPPYARAGGLSEGEHVHQLVRLGDTPVRLIRTDLGLDLLFEADAADAVRAGVVDAGAVEVSEKAAEIVRVERGRPRYGSTWTTRRSPRRRASTNARSASRRVVMSAKRPSRGFTTGANPTVTCAVCASPSRSSPAPSCALGERSVGQLGSSVLSPAFGPIGLALVRREAEPGATLTVGESGATASVVELPFA